MIDLRPLIHPSFWLNTNPAPLATDAERVLFFVFAVILILGAIIRLVATRRKEDRHVTETFSRLGNSAVTMGFLGLLLFFFSFEGIPLLGARFWFLLWALGFLIWIATIVRYVFKVVPVERKAELERQEREKYMPKSH